MQSSFFTMYFCFFNFLFIVSIVSVYIPERSCVLPLCHVPSADWQMPTKKMHKWQTSSEFRTTEQAAQPKNLRGNWKMCVHSRLGSLSLGENFSIWQYGFVVSGASAHQERLAQDLRSALSLSHFRIDDEDWCAGARSTMAMYTLFKKVMQQNLLQLIIVRNSGGGGISNDETPKWKSVQVIRVECIAIYLVFKWRARLLSAVWQPHERVTWWNALHTDQPTDQAVLVSQLFHWIFNCTPCSTPPPPLSLLSN